jgi:hypothetical protein
VKAHLIINTARIASRFLISHLNCSSCNFSYPPLVFADCNAAQTTNAIEEGKKEKLKRKMMKNYFVVMRGRFCLCKAIEENLLRGSYIMHGKAQLFQSLIVPLKAPFTASFRHSNRSSMLWPNYDRLHG